MSLSITTNQMVWSFVLLCVLALHHAIMTSSTQLYMPDNHRQHCPWRNLKSNTCIRHNSKHTNFNGTNNCWFPLARKWPTWKRTWIWILYGKIEKKCPRYFRRDSRGNPRDLNMCRTGRSAALSRGRKSMPPRRESMKLVVQQRKFT